MDFPEGEELEGADKQLEIPQSFTPEVELPKRAKDLNGASIIEFFKRNIDEIKKNKSLEKFTEEQVPILDKHGDVRLE